MARERPGYLFHDRFSRIMQVVADRLGPTDTPKRLLDMPAGAGKFSDALRERGYDVISADFNRERDDYTFVDMNKRLPFDDASFDVVVCLEGIEHVLDPFHLMGELSRVARSGATVIVSTPNIMNLHSRVMFLLTGTFFQFNPARIPQVAPDEELDRDHISPVSFFRLRYLADYYGLDVVDVLTDRYKRKITALLLPAVWTLGALWNRKLYFNKRKPHQAERDAQIHRQATSMPILMGRTMITVMQKRPPA